MDHKILKRAGPLPKSAQNNVMPPESGWVGHMSVIRVFSPSGGQLAAALMGAMAVGRPEPSSKGSRSKPEKTRQKNPDQLTIHQHVYPQRSIVRFAGEDGRVAVAAQGPAVRQLQIALRPFQGFSSTQITTAFSGGAM